MKNAMSTSFFLIAMIGWTVLSTEATASQEFSCAIIGSKKNSIKLSDGVIRNPPLHLINCAGVQLLEDDLTVCAIGNDNEKKCQAFQKNSRLSAEIVRASNKSNLADTVIAMLRGDVRTAAAQTRNSSKYPGMPYGEVVGAFGAVFYDFSDDKKNEIVSLKVYRPDNQQRVVADISKVNSYGAIKLDASDSSVPYSWEITTVDGEKIKGTFIYLAEMAEVIDRRLLEIDSQKELNDASRWYLKAELYAEYGLQFDLDTAMSQLHRRLFQEINSAEK